MKKMFIALAMAAATFAATPDTSLVLKPTPEQVKAAHVVGNKKCPVSGDEIGGKMGPGKTVIYKGQAVELCCPMCLKKFAKDPAKYLAKAEAEAKGGAAHEGHHAM